MSQSGQRPSVRAVPAADSFDARLLREELARPDEDPPRAKPLPLALREDGERKHHAAFLSALNVLQKHGWSLSAIARHLRINDRTLLDWRDGNRPVPRWPQHQLPARGRLAYAREMASSVADHELDEEPPSRACG